MVYYAHSLRKYNTPDEAKELAALLNEFGSVFNPNTEEEIRHAAHLDGSTGALVMRTCLRVVRSDRISSLAFSEYQNYIGKGVYDEIMEAYVHHKPVFIIRDGVVRPFTGYLHVVGEDWAVRWAFVERG